MPAGDVLLGELPGALLAGGVPAGELLDPDGELLLGEAPPFCC